MNEARARRILLLSVLTLLAPARLAEAPAGAQSAPEGRAGADRVEDFGAGGLALSAPDLLGQALRVAIANDYGQPQASDREMPALDLSGPSDPALLDLGATSTATVAEPPRALLLALMLAGVAAVSRGRRRSPRPLRRR